MTHIHWESQGQMTTRKIYNMILMYILKNQQPKDAVYNIERFNLEATKKMSHLMKTTQLAEFLIYSNYIPFQLTEGIFSIPPIGGEFTDAYIPPVKSKIKYDEHEWRNGREGRVWLHPTCMERGACRKMQKNLQKIQVQTKTRKNIKSNQQV